MKKAMLTLSGPDGLVEATEDSFKKLKNTLPSAIRGIVWHSTCVIQSGLYLSVWGSWGAGNTKLEKLSSSSDSRAKWRFIPVEIEPHVWLFRIKNEGNGEYLSSHLPWKNYRNSANWGIAATTSNDYGDYVGYQYNWKIVFALNDQQATFYHIGRRGYLFTDTEIRLSSGTNNADFWNLICDE